MTSLEQQRSEYIQKKKFLIPEISFHKKILVEIEIGRFLYLRFNHQLGLLYCKSISKIFKLKKISIKNFNNSEHNIKYRLK